MNLILSIDIGTGGVRTALYDEQLACKGMQQAEYSTEYSKPGWAEQNAQEIYSSCIESINRVLQESKYTGSDISCITLDCSVHTIVGVDGNCHPVTPVLTWEDSRSDSIVKRWKKEGLSETVYQKTGCPLHPLYAPAKITWWKENNPDLFEQIIYFITLKSFVLQKITGELIEEPATTSGSGLINIHKLDWEDEVLELSGITRDNVPKLVKPSHVIRGITNQFAGETGLRKDPSVVVGSSDAGMSCLGSGTVAADQMTIMVGTSGAVRRIIKRPKLDPEKRTICYYLGDGQWFAGGAINNGGIVLQWYRNTFGKWAEEQAKKEGVSVYTVLSRCAETAEPGSDDLLFLPLLAGERSPFWQGSMRGIIAGISFHHDQSTFIRALMEGVAFRILSVYRPLNELIDPPKEIRVTGGFTRSPFWVRMMADVLGEKLSVTGEPEGSVLGAAAFALYTLGEIDSLERLKELNPIKEIVEPRTELTRLYSEKYEKTMRIYHKLKDEF